MAARLSVRRDRERERDRDRERERDIETINTIGSGVGIGNGFSNSCAGASCTNPILTHFRLVADEPICTSKDGVWRLFAAERAGDRLRATLCVGDKRTLEQACRNKRRFEYALEVYRREVSNLDKYRHPNVLTLLHPLEESPQTLAYAVERISGTLESLLAEAAAQHHPHHNHHHQNQHQHQSQNQHPHPHQNQHQQSQSPAPPVFDELELKYGLLQLTESLKFLHNVNHVFHRNLSLRSVFVTPSGLWKLGGLAFIAKLYQDRLLQPHDPKLPPSAQPDLDFLPPEAVLPNASTETNAGHGGGAAGGNGGGAINVVGNSGSGGTSLSAAGDMFALGLLICAVCARRSMLNTAGSIERYQSGLEQLTLMFKNISFRLPPELIGATQRLLTRDAAQRIGAQSFALLKYFHDEDVMLLQNLANLQSKPTQQRVELFRKLRECLPKLSKKITYSHVLPILLDNIGAIEYDVPVMQTYLTLVRESSNIEFRSAVYSTVKPVIDGVCTIAAAVTLLQNADVLCAKLNADELETLVIPMIVRALQSSSTTQHEAALKALPPVLQELDEGESESKKRVRDALIQLIEQPTTPASLCAVVKAQSLSCLYLVTHHDLAMKFALEQLLEQQLQNPAVYQSLVAYVKSQLNADVQLSYLSDFALPAIIRPLNYCEQLDVAACASAFELIYGLLEKLEEIRTGECRISHCLHRPKLINSSVQTELAGGLPPLITTDSWESDSASSAMGAAAGIITGVNSVGASAGTTSAVKRFFNIGQSAPSSSCELNGFVRVTADSRSLSNELRDGWRSDRKSDQLQLEAPNDIQHASSMEALNQQRHRSNSRDLVITAKLDIPFVANPLERRHSMQNRNLSTSSAAEPARKPEISTPPTTARSVRAPRSPAATSPSSPRLTVTRQQQAPLLSVNHTLQAALTNRRKSFNTMTDAVTSLFQKK